MKKIVGFEDEALEPGDEAIVGSLRFMWDYCVEVPLWDDEGDLLVSQLADPLALSHQLRVDLLDFAKQMAARDSGERPMSGNRLRRLEDDLFRRLQDELAGRYEVSMVRW